MTPQRSRKIFMTIGVARQQHEEISCDLEKSTIPLKEEEKEANCAVRPGGASPMKSRKDLSSHTLTIKPCQRVAR